MISAELAKRLRDAGVECPSAFFCEGEPNHVGCDRCVANAFKLHNLLEEMEKRADYNNWSLTVTNFIGERSRERDKFYTLRIDEIELWQDADTPEDAVATALLEIAGGQG